LLANLYMRRFILGWKQLGHEKRLQAYIVNYADDFVICTRGHAVEALAAMQAMMSKLRLTVNEQKTRWCRLPEDTFTFLGYTFGRLYSHQTGWTYLGPRPALKKIRKLCREISAETDRRTCLRETKVEVRKLNQKLNGWANYFCPGPVVRAYEVVLKHTRRRLRRWLCRKHKVRTGGTARFPNEYLHDQLGLVQLGAKRHRLLWA
jgi:RNA-directed DNA polymerase